MRRLSHPLALLALRQGALVDAQVIDSGPPALGQSKPVTNCVGVMASSSCVRPQSDAGPVGAVLVYGGPMPAMWKSGPPAVS